MTSGDYLRDQMQMEDRSVTTSNQMNKGHENKGINDLSVNSGTLEEKNEEVPEVAPECSKSDIEECASGETDRTLYLIKTGVPLDDMQNKLCFNNFKDDSSETVSPCLTDSSSTSSSDNLTKHQNQLSSPVTCNSDGHSEGDSKDVGTLKPCPTLDEPKLDEKSAPHLPFRAAPLSNRDRLVLRKQALKMKKRPVLAIGIMSLRELQKQQTHFKKHPLAIVNIKNRADGTPIQQMISELEEATGSVLVSREPNKVILCRRWGAEVAQKSSVENSVNEGEKEVISPQLLEAIRLECGLQMEQSRLANVRVVKLHVSKIGTRIGSIFLTSFVNPSRLKGTTR